MIDDRKRIGVLGRHWVDDERLRRSVDHVGNPLRPLRFAVEHQADFSLVGVDVTSAGRLMADQQSERATPLEVLHLRGDFVALMNIEASCHVVDLH
jgi:hypothetical protein